MFPSTVSAIPWFASSFFLSEQYWQGINFFNFLSNIEALLQLYDQQSNFLTNSDILNLFIPLMLSLFVFLPFYLQYHPYYNLY